MDTLFKFISRTHLNYPQNTIANFPSTYNPHILTSIEVEDVFTS